MKKIKIVKNTEVVPGIFTLSFRKEFDFIPGQVVKITSEAGMAPRLYSIASGVNDAEVLIIYDIKPEGQLTNVLKNMKSGDEIFVSEPFGNFVHKGGKSWWIATGTGIAPFCSMLRSGIASNITLVHGVRKPEHLLFKNEFTFLGKSYFPCCPGKSAEGMFSGRVTDFLKHLDFLPADTSYYLCGNAEMVVEVRDLLIEKHIPFGNIFSEIYF